MAQALPLLALEPQVQELAQAAALVQVQELVSAVEQLELVQVRERELELVSAVEPLELVRVLVRAVMLEPQTAVLAQAREPPLVRVQGREPARQQEPVVEPEQVRELRVSRQQEQQQHRLQAAAQELPPYLPALPMKAPY